jgi:hypothetical protein
MQEAKSSPIADDELHRDQRVYRNLKRKDMTEGQKAGLSKLVRGGGKYRASDYRRYQARLLELGAEANIMTRILARDKNP